MRTTGLALLAATLLAGATMAQPPRPMPPGAGEAGDAAEWQARRAEAEARHEADVALLLELKPAQRALLHAYHASRAVPPPGMPKPGGPAVEGAAPVEQDMGARLAEMQARLDRRTKAEGARLAAARAFFTALDADQKAKLAALERLGRPLHGQGAMRGMPGHPPAFGAGQGGLRRPRAPGSDGSAGQGRRQRPLWPVRKEKPKLPVSPSGTIVEP